MELIDYHNLRKDQAALRAEGRYIGIGVATYVEICGFGPYESSTVRVEPSGEVSIFTGISPHGQGQETRSRSWRPNTSGPISTAWSSTMATPPTRLRATAPWAAAGSRWAAQRS